MDTPSIGAAVGLIGGIALGALFASLGAGISALGEVRLLAIKEGGGAQSRLATRALAQLPVIRARVVVGRVFATSAVALGAATLGAATRNPRLTVATVAASLFLYEVIAQAAATMARRRASRDALRLLRLMRPLELLMAPFAAPVVWVHRLTERVVPEIADPDAERIGEMTVEQAIDEVEEAGSMAEDQAEMLRSVLEFHSTVAREIMVPRTRMVAFDIATPIEEVLEKIVDEGHSRYPVYREQIDRVEGVLYAKDLFHVVTNGGPAEGTTLDRYIRQPAFFVPERQKIGAILREMQANHSHLAIVVDEFGGASGMVTLEDILEEIVGEIQDEHDEELPQARSVAPDRFVADASIGIEDLEEIVGEEIPHEDGAFETLGGMVTHLAGRVPAIGDQVEVGGFAMTVLDATERQVTRVELWRRPAPAQSDEAAGEVPAEPEAVPSA